MLNAVIIDFETRSRCNLLTHGTDNYAEDDSTEVLCMAAYDRGTGEKWLWHPHDGDLPESLITALHQTDFVAAHNARFDQLIWEFVAVELYGFPELPMDKWYCTSAQCRVNAIPAGLDNASLFVTGRRGKLGNGKALIKELSIPNADGEFNSNPASLKLMGEYCLQDVMATEDVVAATRVMTQDEHRDWLVSERINDRGFKADIELAKLATQQADAELANLAELLDDLTDGAVTAVTQVARVKKWFLHMLSDATIAKYLTRTVEDKKTKLTTVKISFDKSARSGLLEAYRRGELDLPQEAATVLEIVEEGNKSSVSKFKKFILLANQHDHRVRGAYLFAGASQTKRFSAKGLQPHNFRRECIAPEEVERAKQLLRENAALLIDGSSVMEVLSKLLRPTVIPDTGKKFVVGDWAAIEGRVLPWLADSRGSEKVLDIFRADQDIYLHTAAAMGIDDRQIGKVATLALGFQGGVNAFNAMGRAYGLHLAEAEAQAIVDKWREANAWAVVFWRKLDAAALAAVRYPMTWRKAGRVRYLFAPEMLGATLICELPDGSVIQYPQARIDLVETPWGEKKPAVTYAKAGIHPAADEVEWPRSTLYAGLACENVTQAVAASLLRGALHGCASANLPVVLHVHDEIVLEVGMEIAQTARLELQKVMETAPDWAAGLPLKAIPDIKTRYGK